MQRQRGELVPVAEASGGPACCGQRTDPDLGFMARMMALCSLPRTNPGNRLQYKRVNGPWPVLVVGTRWNRH